MEDSSRSHNDNLVTLFNREFSWWPSVYREDLPKGFFSFEMRKRLELVTDLLTARIRALESPAVLECGCGAGDILKRLTSLRCSLTGLDLNPRYLEMAAENVPGVTLIDGNVEQLPFPDGSFDIVYAVGVYQYLKDDNTAAKEMCRVTRDGGYILISVPNYTMLHLLIDPYYWFRPLLNRSRARVTPSADKFDESMIRRYTRSRLASMFHRHKAYEKHTVVTSYGPIRFWQKRIFPLPLSMRLSEILRKLSELPACSVLKHAGNHWIMTLQKGLTTANRQAM